MCFSKFKCFLLLGPNCNLTSICHCYAVEYLSFCSDARFHLDHCSNLNVGNRNLWRNWWRLNWRLLKFLHFRLKKAFISMSCKPPAINDTCYILVRWMWACTNPYQIVIRIEYVEAWAPIRVSIANNSFYQHIFRLIFAINIALCHRYFCYSYFIYSSRKILSIWPKYWLNTFWSDIISMLFSYCSNVLWPL